MLVPSPSVCAEHDKAIICAGIGKFAKLVLVCNGNGVYGKLVNSYVQCRRIGMSVD